MTTIALLSPVVLIVDLPDRGLTKGQIGTVVEYLSRDGEGALLVEFSEEAGQTYAMTSVSPDQIVVLHPYRSRLSYFASTALALMLPNPVVMIAGVVTPSFLSCFKSSTPSIPGIIRSSRMATNRWVLAFSSASDRHTLSLLRSPKLIPLPLGLFVAAPRHQR